MIIWNFNEISLAFQKLQNYFQNKRFQTSVRCRVTVVYCGILFLLAEFSTTLPPTLPLSLSITASSSPRTDKCQTTTNHFSSYIGDFIYLTIWNSCLLKLTIKHTFAFILTYSHSRGYGGPRGRLDLSTRITYYLWLLLCDIMGDTWKFIMVGKITTNTIQHQPKRNT